MATIAGGTATRNCFFFFWCLKHLRRVAKCQYYTFDGIFRYQSSSMLIHLYIWWALVYGKMTRLVLLHKGILGQFMQKITKKACFLEFPSRKFIFWYRNSKLAINVFKGMLLILEYVALAWLQGTPCCKWFCGENRQKRVIFVNFPKLECHPVDYPKLSTK